jgi:hypothetical protein
LRTVTIETDDAEAPTVLVPLTIGGRARPGNMIRSTATTGNVQKPKATETKPETTKPPVTAP